METNPGSVAGLPLTAASRPRVLLRFSDSCGVNIGSWVRVSVCTGWTGSDMLRTATPSEAPAALMALVGNSSAVS